MNEKLALHNATQNMDALEKKFRKRTNRINALRIELEQLERSLRPLIERIDKAKTELKAARAAYRVSDMQNRRESTPKRFRMRRIQGMTTY